MNIEELKKMVREIIKQELDETSTTGGVPGYLSAKAFSKDPKSTSNAGTEESERLGFKKAKETHINFKEIWENKLLDTLNEVSYNEYKKYPGMTSKQKLNMAIKECNRALWEVEKYLKQNKKLKEEESLGLDEYWKSTGRTLVKMNERLRRIQKEIKKFGVKEVAALLEAESQQMVDNVKSAFQDMTNTKVMSVEFGTYQGEERDFVALTKARAKTFHVKFGKKMNIKPTELMNMYDDYYEGAEYGEPDKVKVPQIMGAPVKLSDDTYVFTIK